MNDFIGFIRPKITLYITGIALFGYLLFNPLDYRIFFVFLGAFGISTAVYSFNMITDVEEDVVNSKRINPYVKRPAGLLIVIVSFLMGFASTFYLSRLAVYVYLIMSCVGFGYSYYRLKRIFPLKNLLTPVVTSSAFLLGATVTNPITVEITLNTLFVMLPVFMISVLGDLRDYEGDRKAGCKTLPTVIGYKKAKYTMYLSLLLFSVLSLLYFKPFAFMLIFMIPTVNLLIKDRPNTYQFLMLIGFALLPVYALVMLWI